MCMCVCVFVSEHVSASLSKYNTIQDGNTSERDANQIMMNDNDNTRLCIMQLKIEEIYRRTR